VYSVILSSGFVTFNISSTNVPLGTVTFTSTIPSALNSSALIYSSLFASSVITTVGAVLAVISKIAEPLPSSDTFPSSSVIIAITSIISPSFGGGNSNDNPSSIISWSTI